jgi:hypothetical protein
MSPLHDDQVQMCNNNNNNNHHNNNKLTKDVEKSDIICAGSDNNSIEKDVCKVSYQNKNILSPFCKKK